MAGSGFTITVTGANTVISTFRRIDEDSIRQLKQTIFKSGQTIETGAKRKAPVDTGRLRGSIEHSVSNGGLTFSVYPTVAYGAYLEFGTRGGVSIPSAYTSIASAFRGGGGGMPPPSALAGWTARHGMAGLEFVIARAIQKNGTKAQPFLFPAFEAEKNNFVNDVKTILQNLR